MDIRPRRSAASASPASVSAKQPSLDTDIRPGQPGRVESSITTASRNPRGPPASITQYSSHPDIAELASFQVDIRPRRPRHTQPATPQRPQDVPVSSNGLRVQLEEVYRNPAGPPRRDSHARNLMHDAQSQTDGAHGTSWQSVQSASDVISRLRRELQQVRASQQDRHARNAMHDRQTQTKEAHEDSPQHVQSTKDTISRLQEELQQTRAELDQAHFDLSGGLEHDKECHCSEEIEAMRRELDSLQKKNALGEIAIKECRKAWAEAAEERTRRRRLLEQLCTLRGVFRAVGRIMPGARQDLFSIDSGSRLRIVNKRHTLPAGQVFHLDGIVEAGHGDAAVLEEMAPLLESALDGSCVAILFYGRTGTGKSYNSRLVLNGIRDVLFEKQEKQGEQEGMADRGPPIQVQISYVEVYGESLWDLLGDRPQKLQTKSGLVRLCAAGANASIATGPGEFDTIISKAARQRRTAATKCNPESSRSHAAVVLSITHGQNSSNSGFCSGGSIALFDLAGHERHAESGTDIAEASSISTALNEVGVALQKVRDHSRKQRRHWQDGTESSTTTTTVTSSFWRGGLLTRVLGGFIEGEAAVEGMAMTTSKSSTTNQSLRPKVLVFATLDLKNEKAATASVSTLEFTSAITKA